VQARYPPAATGEPSSIAMEGLRSLLESDEGLRVVAAENSSGGREGQHTRNAPVFNRAGQDLMVLDKALGAQVLTDCLFVLRRSASLPAAVVWGVSVSESEALRFMHAGASGVVRKTLSSETILPAVHTVVAGGT
jgi:DNA-binding NarL/FixJ family response regulator